MYNSHLKNIVAERISEGRQDLSYRNRELVYKESPEIFDLLNYEDDDIFLEPMLFKYRHLMNENRSLGQTLFGYVNNDSKPDHLIVYTDSQGRAYIPAIGHLQTDMADQKLELGWNRDSNTIIEKPGADYKILGITAPTDLHGFEVYRDEVSQLSGYFNLDGLTPDLGVKQLSEKHFEEFKGAMNVVERIFPEFYASFSEALKSFYLFHTESNRSFASRQSMGISFINVEHENGLVFFLEDILHQSSHNMFYYALLDEDMFAVNPEDSLANYSTHKQAHGEIYGTFHGLYTLTNINTCLTRCLNQHVFEGQHHYEVQGRLSDNMKRFKTAIELFDNKEIFTDEGWKLYESLKDSYHSLYEQNGGLVDSFDTSNQPYVFSFKKFMDVNPAVVQ